MRRVSRSVAVALAVGLTLTVVALIVVLSGSPVTVLGTNSIPATPGVAYAKGGSSGCQLSGTLPAGTSAVRLSVSQNTGPKVTMHIFSGSTLVAQGEHPAGWGIDESVTLPIKRVSRSVPVARLCVTFGQAIEPIEINGSVVRTTAPSGRSATGVRFRVEYLHEEPSSWLSLAGTVARLMGYGHAPSGTWIVFLLIALMVSVATLASWLVLRELR